MASNPRYDVFLSFRGDDTRSNFNSHLHNALSRKNIRTFRDDKLDRGKEISSTLFKIIEGSKIAVIIFSKNYADSRWCLDELVKIMECSKVLGQIVLPVFYHVDPSDVRKQSGDFGEAFQEVRKRCNNSEIIQSWSNALTEAGNLSGWDSKNYGLEANLCEEVAWHIKKLCPISFTASPGLVGIDSVAKEIISCLCIGELDVRYVGLWGMGGIGKTTIAEFLHAQISHHFDSHCIFHGIRETSEKYDLLHLRRSFISLLLKSGSEDINGLNELPTDILDELGGKKVLVVLDDVDNPNQLDALGVTDGWFGPGSRIIITSRDEQVLRSGGVSQIYEVKGLARTHASKLLRMRAFPKTDPDESYTLPLNKVLDYCKGVPLALKVLGSQLCKKSPKEWESLLKKLQESGDPNITTILRTSYESLDQMEKTIFLDVACFYKGYLESWLKGTLYGCDCDVRACCCSFSWALNRLKEKCLITIIDDKVLGMHDLMQEMGKGIAGKEGSRLWNSKEICHLLRSSKGSETVEGIVFDMDEMELIHLHPQAFSMMPNLRILHFKRGEGLLSEEDEQVYFILKPDESNHLPYKLTLIHWPNYPFKSLPSTFFMENLVELKIGGNNITQLWDGDKCPQNLKSLFVQGCQQLMNFPDLSSATNLRIMAFLFCKSLEEINPSIKCLHKLLILDLRRCTKLKSLPSLVELESLKVLDLSGCLNLKMLPDLPKCIRKLTLDRSGVEEWSSSIQCLENLHLITMRDCNDITWIPGDIVLQFDEVDDDDHIVRCYLDGICKLDFTLCPSLHSLPLIKGNVLEINLMWTGIQELSLLDGLVSLKTLNLRWCSKLVELPHLDWLTSLESIDLVGCSILARLPPLRGLSRLQVLKLGWNDILMEIPKLPDQLIKLQVTRCTSLINVASTPERQKFYGYYELSYINCINLNQNSSSNIMADGYSIAKQLAIIAKRSFEYGGYKVGMVGSEIPEWVLNQNHGSSIEIDFPPNGLNTKSILGFVFFVVLDSHHGIYEWLDLRIEVNGRFKNAAGYDEVSAAGMLFTFRDINVVPISDHVFLLFNSCDWVTRLELHDWVWRNPFNGKGAFDFIASSVGAQRYINVKKCGLCVLHERKGRPDPLHCTSKQAPTTLSSATNLRYMGIGFCESLEEINPSIKCLHKLVILDLRDCTKLKSLPSLVELESLKVLELSRCLNLKMLPNLPKRIQKLSLDCSGVQEWSSSIQCLENLNLVNMRACNNITTIPSNIVLQFNEVNDDDESVGGYLDDKYKLDFGFCRSLHSLPLIKGNVLDINLTWTGIKELPLLDGLVSLKTLNLSWCSKLVELPHLDGLTSLESIDLVGCSNLARLPPLRGLSRLQVLKLGWNDILMEIPKLPDQLIKLQVTRCPSLINVASTPEREKFYGYYELSYINCINLNQNSSSNIMADGHSIAKQLAIVAKRRFQYGGCKVCRAGSEIPEWVLNQNHGSSIEIDFPPNSLNAESILGFVFFVVLDFHHGIHKWRNLRIEVNGHFKNAAGDGEVNAGLLFTFTDVDVIPESDHVFLLFYSCDWVGRHKWARRNAFNAKGAFDFVASSVGAQRYINVKRCGLCVLHE